MTLSNDTLQISNNKYTHHKTRNIHIYIVKMTNFPKNTGGYRQTRPTDGGETTSFDGFCECTAIRIAKKYI